MIKKALFLSIAALGMFSCSSDDDTNTVNEPSVVGKWQPAKFMVYSGKDGSIIANKSSEPNGCEKNSFIDLNSTGKWHEMDYYTNIQSQCAVDVDATYDYTYDSTSKTLQVKYSNGSSDVYTVKKITDTELELVEQLFDTDGDGIKDQFTTLFKKL